MPEPGVGENSSLLERCIASGALAAEIIMPGVPTPTVPDAAAALGVLEAQILKSLLFVDPNGQVTLAVACGDSRIDRERLAKVRGRERLKLAAPELVLSTTGYLAGGTPPVCHATRIDVVVDQRVMNLDVGYAGGGRVDALLRITPGEIVRFGGATVADIATAS